MEVTDSSSGEAIRMLSAVNVSISGSLHSFSPVQLQPDRMKRDKIDKDMI